MTLGTHMPVISQTRLVAVLSAIALALFFILPASSAHAAASSMFSASPNRIFLGESVTITWDSAVDFKCVGNFNTNGASSGTVTVQPSSTGVKTYVIDCSSPNNRFQEREIVTVNSAPPPSELSATITASPNPILTGSSVLVSWSSSGATTCRGTNFSTGGAVKGSVSATPLKDTTYSVTCDGTTFSSTPGTWQYAYPDVTDLWCTQTQGNYKNYYTENQCPGSNPEGQSCVGSGSCAVNNWQTKGGGVGRESTEFCNLKSDVYQCNGGSTPNQATDSVTVVVNNPVVGGSCSGSPVSVPPGETVTWTYTPSTGAACFSYECAVTEQRSPHAIFGNPDQCQQTEPGPTGCDYGGYFKPVCQVDSCTFAYSWSGTDGLSGTGKTISKTYTTAGAKSASVKIISADSSKTISCSNSVTVTDSLPQCSDGIDNDGDGLKDAEDPGCKTGDGGGGGGGAGYNPNDTSESPNPQCSDGIDNNGNGLIDYPADSTCDSPFDNNEEPLPPPLLSLLAPPLVLSGTSVSLTWSASNVEGGSCTLSGTNGDSWKLPGVSGERTSAPLLSETIFTLSCTDLNGNPLSTATTVRILPSFEEI